MLRLQVPGLPFGGGQPAQFIEVEDQAFAGVIQQLPHLGYRVLRRQWAELSQGVDPLIPQAEQMGTQLAYALGEVPPPVDLSCL